MTAPGNPFFARALVNRAWAHDFGAGFVDPVDGLSDSNQPVRVCSSFVVAATVSYLLALNWPTLRAVRFARAGDVPARLGGWLVYEAPPRGRAPRLGPEWVSP